MHTEPLLSFNPWYAEKCRLGLNRNPALLICSQVGGNAGGNPCAQALNQLKPMCFER